MHAKMFIQILHLNCCLSASLIGSFNGSITNYIKVDHTDRIGLHNPRSFITVTMQMGSIKQNACIKYLIQIKRLVYPHWKKINRQKHELVSLINISTLVFRWSLSFSGFAVTVFYMRHKLTSPNVYAAF